MRFLTWNIRCQNAGDDARGCGWNVRRARVRATIGVIAPDIFAVQEALAPQMDDLRADWPEFEGVGVGRDDGERAGEFCGLFFRRERFEWRAHQTRWLSVTPDVPSRGWDADLKRIASRVRLFDRETERELEVWNTHFDHIGAQARLESARFLRRELEFVAVGLLCGDFNASPASPPMLDLASGDWRDARAHSQRAPTGEIATFCGFDAPIGGEEARIDYVWVSPGGTIRNYAVPAPIFPDWPPASDHRPVVVELDFS